MKNILLIFFLSYFHLQLVSQAIVVVDWSNLVTGAINTVNTSATPNAVVTITGANFTSSTPKYNVSNGGANWAMTGLGLEANWPGTVSSHVIDIVFTIPVCGDLSFDIHDINGDTGIPFEDKVMVNGYDASGILIPVIATNYIWSNCPAGGICGAVQLMDAGTSNSRIGRCSNGNSNLNGYGNQSQKVTFTLHNPTAPGKIKRVQITYASSSTANTNGYMANGTNPGAQSIVIGNVFAKPAPNINISYVCSVSSSSATLTGALTSYTAGTTVWTTTGGAMGTPNAAVTIAKSPATYTLTATNLNGCPNTATIALTTIICNLLPIELSNFEATIKNDAVNITWETLSEINSNYFMIERSVDGVEFEPISQIKSFGNSNEIKKYNYTDENPYSSLNFYRLKHTDIAGNTKYSKIIDVEFISSKIVVTNVKPNPTMDVIHFDFYTPAKTDVLIELLDITGVIVYKELKPEIEGKLNYEIDLSHLSQGIYTLKVSSINTETKSYTKIIKN